MKLRLRHNSVRLRLTQGEVSQLRDTGAVEEHIDFGSNQRLDYRLLSSDTQPAITAEFLACEIRISAPKEMVREWATTGQVGMEAGGPLRILIEKDFQCLDTSHPEENIDTFPNPLEGKVC